MHERERAPGAAVHAVAGQRQEGHGQDGDRHAGPDGAGTPRANRSSAASNAQAARDANREATVTAAAPTVIGSPPSVMRSRWPSTGSATAHMTSATATATAVVPDRLARALTTRSR